MAVVMDPAEKKRQIKALAKQIGDLTVIVKQLVAQRNGQTADDLADQEDAHSMDPTLADGWIDHGFKPVAWDSRARQRQSQDVYELGRQWMKRPNPHYKTRS